ncbi:hypothetical protein M0R04_10150 [Candidatus Dojkabacteria bacterium]|nr:hypothetical protein [Candidatus Dojkabacteria bacterium]
MSEQEYTLLTDYCNISGESMSEFIRRSVKDTVLSERDKRARVGLGSGGKITKAQDRAERNRILLDEYLSFAWDYEEREGKKFAVFHFGINGCGTDRQNVDEIKADIEAGKIKSVPAHFIMKSE